MDADEDGFPFLNFQRREDFSFHRELEGKSSVSAVDLLYFYLLVSGGIAVCRRDGRKKGGNIFSCGKGMISSACAL